MEKVDEIPKIGDLVYSLTAFFDGCGTVVSTQQARRGVIAKVRLENSGEEDELVSANLMNLGIAPEGEDAA